jgi:hypothetical protein
MCELAASRSLWWPHVTVPTLVVSKGAKTFTIQVGQRQEIVSVDRLIPQFSLGLSEDADWGGGGGACGGSCIVFKYMFVICVSLSMAPVSQ